MKKHYPVLALCLSAALLSSCSSETEETSMPETPSYFLPTTSTAPDFPQPDGSVHLNGAPSQVLLTLLKKTDLEQALVLGETNITEAQYEEIKAFTDDLVKDCTDEMAKYNAIFKWVSTNIVYDYADNDPYPVFTSRRGICQGYSNLMKVMLLTQGIPVLVANGYCYGMGHAWNYTYCGGKWMVCDATNKGSFNADMPGTYYHLSPTRADIVIFEDDNFTYEYFDHSLNIGKVKGGSEQTVLPYSTHGFRVTSFNPHEPLPENIQELYIGKNIETLGSDIIGLVAAGKNLNAVYVDETNTHLRSHEGAVYQRSGTSNYLYYVPGKLEFLKLLPMETVEKNTIYEQPGLKAIEFAEGTKRIEAYAVENCPNLEKAYVPREAVIETDAFYNVSPKFEIIRGNSTGIGHITF